MGSWFPWGVRFPWRFPRHVSELVLVRHGETLHNTAQRVGRFFANADARTAAGELPDHLVPLSETGRLQARSAARQLAQMAPFDTCFDSGYRRSVETLDLILSELAAQKMAIPTRRTHPDLREREPGYTFLMTAAEVQAHFPWYAKYEAVTGRFYATPPGGESVAHVLSRVHMFLNSLRRARSGERVLVVTHGRVMLAFRYWLERIPVTEMDNLFDAAEMITNCSVLHYRWSRSKQAMGKVGNS